MDPKDRMRELVIEELIQTERDYATDLGVLFKVSYDETNLLGLRIASRIKNEWKRNVPQLTSLCIEVGDGDMHHSQCWRKSGDSW